MWPIFYIKKIGKGSKKIKKKYGKFHKRSFQKMIKLLLGKGSKKIKKKLMD